MRKILLGLIVLIIGAAVAGYFTLRRGDIPHATLDKTYASPASKFIDMGGGVEAHWRDEGNPNARPILLIHGFSASLHTWEPWVRELGGEYRMVSVDLPGHGLTRTPEGYRPSIEGYADFIDAFMGKIGLEHAMVVGSSMGGNTAWMLALRHPRRVDSLVLVGASGWREESKEGAEEEPLVFKLLRTPLVGPLLMNLDNSRLVRGGLEASFVDKSLVDDAMVARYVDMARAPNHRAVLLAITLNRDERALATKEALARITAPTLILHGDQDNLVPVGGATLFRDAIPGAQAIIYENVGHIPQEEIPARSAQDLRTFLKRIEPEAVGGVPLAAAVPHAN
ncbi:MAG: alpha/beta hydrolase [Hyphomonadaceae bacterium]|nr:alpha/beta hydrolase [Hyphomonadaceae bacterium]